MKSITTITSPMAVLQACVWEATARKLGNVHPKADFETLKFQDLIASAQLIHEIVGESNRSRHEQGTVSTLGLRIWTAISATKSRVRTNANLGIVLLLAPLASIDWDCDGIDVRADLAEVLENLTVNDTQWMYQAIRLANPGGLGRAEGQDVADTPTVTPLQAMALAADRDLIARQYSTHFADVFNFGVPRLVEGFTMHRTVEAAVIQAQIHWLAAYPDSLIARKAGVEVAEDVQQRAKNMLNLGGIETPEGRRAGVELDRYLRGNGNRLNPGTSADLIAASLFVALKQNKLSPDMPFDWPAPDWL